MKIVSVIPLKKGPLKGDLTYFTSLNVGIGDIVYVPLRSKKTLGLITSVENLQESKGDIKGMNFNLRKITENKGTSIFLKEFWETIFDTSKYFAQNKSSLIISLIPNIFIEHYDKISKFEKNEEGVEKISLENKQNLKAEKLLLQYPEEDRISIYKTLVRESFARGKSVFVVLPTEFDINKFTDQLKKGIEQFTFILHSSISAKKNLITYEKIINSSHPILILATPPFLSIPRKDIGTIILEHENSSAYKTISRPHFDLRTFVEIYASKINAKFVLADEILRFDTIGRVDTDNLHPLHPLSYRIDSSTEISVLGKDTEEEKKTFKILNEESVEETKSALDKKQNIFIFSLRKGLATMTVCKDCNETITCEKCGAPLVLYLSHQGKNRMFVCNRCERDFGADIACPSCGGWNLMPLGIGTDTVYEEVKKLFLKTKIFKLDKESAKTAKGAKDIIKEFEESSGSVLIGTEMAFFYLKDKVPLSIIASFDSLWSIPNFKMSEKIIQIVLGMLASTSKKLIIQTKNENDGAVLGIKSGNLLSFVREELEDRKKLGYPPFKRFIKITHLGDKEQSERAKKILGEMFAEYSPEIFSGFIAKLKGKYVTNALIKLDTNKWSLPELSIGGNINEALLSKLLSLPPIFEISVDPEDLL
ncbi:MAG: hypothetical protein WCT44_01850 [Candidatus Paceibacterota bacterium]